MRPVQRENYTDEIMQNIERIVKKAKELNSEFFVAGYKAAWRLAAFAEFSYPSESFAWLYRVLQIVWKDNYNY